jgi:hypothetical protein
MRPVKSDDVPVSQNMVKFKSIQSGTSQTKRVSCRSCRTAGCKHCMSQNPPPQLILDRIQCLNNRLTPAQESGHLVRVREMKWECAVTDKAGMWKSTLKTVIVTNNQPRTSGTGSRPMIRSTSDHDASCRVCSNARN